MCEPLAFFLPFYGGKVGNRVILQMKARTNKNDKIMKYFKEQEFWCKCNQCQKGDADLDIPEGGMIGGVTENIKALVENVLDPLREKYGKPIVVNSGYRCPRHNLAVGGATQSQHMKGEAADITAGSPEENKRLAEILEQNGKYDQMIKYLNPDGGIRFIHVSWKRNGQNRKQRLRKA